MPSIFRGPAARFFLLIGFFVLLFVLESAYPVDIDAVRAWIAQYPKGVSAVLYIGVYVGVTTVFWFGTIDFFRFTGAILFGPLWSTLFVYIAEVMNAVILSNLSRKMGRDYVIEKFHVQEKDIEFVRKRTGFWWALALRMNMLVPFRFMDVGFGLAPMPLNKYFWACVAGSPVRIFGLQFLIFQIGEAIFKKPEAMLQYFLDNPLVMGLTFAYIAVVTAVTVAAIILTLDKADRASA